ncbi:MAG TPA: LysM peptidoglycan-binding domain-containing protein, partial [Thermodesulfobacteriota bacterium]|nr:LysM peptidoglycan-binding domain-containing protein [Thermodesulfobacteriota bacterium]
MRRLVGLFFAAILMFSFGFVLPGLTQETKETEGVYTIKKGDTLWDISSKFLKDPFLWPKLWERNPYITNPHWIYPGNQVQLTSLEPTRKEEQAKKEEPPSAEPAKKEEPQKVVGEKAAEPAKEAESKTPDAKASEVARTESPASPPVEKKREEV